MEITKYTIGVAFSFDRKEQQRLDNHLKALEAKFAKFSSRFGKSFGISIDNFSVNEKKLNLVLGNALDAASKKVTFEISNFAVNTRNMQAALMRASRIAGGTVSFTSGGVGQGQLSREEWDRRALTTSRLRREEAVARQAERLEILRERALLSPRRMAGSAGVGGAVGGSFGSLFPSGGVLGAGLALAGGGYGLAALNQRNQQVVSAQLQTQSIVQEAGGTATQGTQTFDWLRSQGNRIGFNYLEAAPDFNKLLAGLTGAGMSVEQGQDVFKGFAELARVRKLDKVSQNRLFRALSQVAGKDKLMSEELRGQVAEALPGGVALFAQAYQDMLKSQGKGGGLTGSAAIKALDAAMKKGQVSGEILTFAGAAASKQAETGLPAAQTASQAEQQRFQNVTNDLAVLASQKGVEEGFARIFRTLNQGLSESGPLIERLARGFNEATKWADDLLLFPQSFARALDGRDSLVADWLGVDATVQLREDWKSIKESITTIMGMESPAWLPTLESTAKELAGLLRTIADITGKAPTKYTELSDVETIDPFGTGGYKSPAGLFGAAFDNARFNMQQAKERGEAVYGDPTSPFYKDPQGYEQFVRDRSMAQAEERVRENVVNSFDISITVDPVTLANMDVGVQAQALADQFRMELENTMLQFPVKE